MSWSIQRFATLVADTKNALVGGPFGSKLTTRDYVDEGVPVIRGANMSNGRFILEADFVFVTDEKKRKDLQSNMARPGDLIFTQRGTLGQVAIIPDDASFSEFVVSQSQMKATLDPEKADTAFYYYFFSSQKVVDTILNMTSSSGVPHINLGTLKDFEVPVPDLPTQQRIAGILSAYDDLIENNRRRIGLLEQTARLLYREWFVHLRFPGHETAQIVDGLPEGWEHLPIGDIWSISYGKNLPTSKISETGKFPVHGADSIIGYYEQKNVDERLCLVTCRGNGSGNVRRTFGPTFVTNNCFVLRPNHRSDEISFHFTLNAMQELRLQDMRTGAAQPQLTLAGMAHVRVALPTADLLERYNVLAGPKIDLADALRAQNILLTRARDLLLPRLMDGRIPV